MNTLDRTTKTCNTCRFKKFEDQLKVFSKNETLHRYHSWCDLNDIDWPVGCVQYEREPGSDDE